MNGEKMEILSISEETLITNAVKVIETIRENLRGKKCLLWLHENAPIDFNLKQTTHVEIF